MSKFFHTKDSKEIFLDSISNYQLSDEAQNATGNLAEMIFNVLSQTSRQNLIKLKSTFLNFIKLFNDDINLIIGTLQVNGLYQPTFLATFASITNMLTSSMEDLYSQFNALLNSLIMIGTVLCEKAIVKMSKTWMVKQSSDLLPALAGGVVLGTDCLNSYYESKSEIFKQSAGASAFDQNKNAFISAFTIAIEGTSAALLKPEQKISM